MMSLIKTKQDWSRHLKLMVDKCNSMPYSEVTKEPDELPCLVYSYLQKDLNGLLIKNVFCYKDEARQLLNTKN